MIFSWNWKKKDKIKLKNPKSTLQKRSEVPPSKQITPKVKKKESLPKTIKKPIKNSTTKEIVDYKKKFIKTFKKLTRTHRALVVWEDFIVMYACALSNAVDKEHYDEREKKYLKIIHKYNKEEQNIFPELAGLVVLALESNQEQDFLGELFMYLELGNKTNGQFFTPYHISDLMSKIVIDSDIKSTIDKKGFITINDSCCGSGVMLIAGINEAKRQLEKINLNFQRHVFVVAQDIDETVALMCYIQLTLLGVAGYVKVGDAITEPIVNNENMDNCWYTMMYFADVWKISRGGLNK